MERVPGSDRGSGDAFCIRDADGLPDLPLHLIAAQQMHVHAHGSNPVRGWGAHANVKLSLATVGRAVARLASRRRVTARRGGGLQPERVLPRAVGNRAVTGTTAADPVAHPDGAHRGSGSLAARSRAGCGTRPCRERIRDGTRPSALALRAAQRRRARRRDQRAARPEDSKGIKGWFFKHFQKKAGAGGAEREPHHAAARRGRRRRRRDAHACSSTSLNSPFGMALVGNDLYVANTRRARALSLHAGRHADHRAPATKVADLPAGPINHHWTKNVIASARRLEAVRDGRLEQQRRRERHRRRRRSARRSGRSIREPAATACSHRACAIPSAWRGSRTTGALWIVGERARRARQRPRARLHDVGARRRLLRLAVQLLRPARRRRA